jgi:TolB-like protein
MCRGDVGIIAGWSTMAYKGRLERAREIGEALQVDYLLEGSTRGEGLHMRITARLVEAASEAHRWSETYDRTIGDWLSVQADVAGDVAQSLVKELVPPPRLVATPDAHRRHSRLPRADLHGRRPWSPRDHIDD